MEGGWILLVMVAFISLCMITERGDWKIWQRIGFVPLAWIVEALLAPLAAITIGVVVLNVGHPQLVNRSVTLFASVPMVIIAMRRSYLFVRPVNWPINLDFRGHRIRTKKPDQTPNEHAPERWQCPECGCTNDGTIYRCHKCGSSLI